MARSVGVDEVIPCPLIRSGEATSRLLAIAGRDYQTVSAASDRLQFARTSRPLWSLVLGIILTPVIIGIPLLLIKRTETWFAAIEEDHRHVQIQITGRVLPGVMAELHEALGAPQQAPAPPAATAPVEAVRPSRMAPSDTVPSVSAASPPVPVA